ncbi:MAG: hypothetical protein SNG59_02260 [Rikenellaceae bacterium]
MTRGGAGMTRGGVSAMVLALLAKVLSAFVAPCSKCSSAECSIL